MAKKERPDYTKYMRRPEALELSAPADRDDRVPSSARVPAEVDIPWAEVIIDPEPAVFAGRTRVHEQRSRDVELPPWPVIALVLVALAVLSQL